jgi:cytosine permease
MFLLEKKRPAAQILAEDDFPLTEVPHNARRGLFSLITVLLGFVFFTPTMLAGAQISTGFRPGSLLTILVTGSLILGCYVAVLAVIGARTGLTTVLLARFTLGSRGSKWADILLGGTQVCWYAVTAAFFAELVAQAFGWHGYEWLIIVVGASLTGVTAYYGYRSIELLSTLSVPLMFALCCWVLFMAFDEVGGAAGFGSIEPTSAIPWATAVTIVVGTFVSGGTQTPNWSRFARLPRDAFVAAFGAFFLANLLMLFFGAVGAMAYGNGDFVTVLLQLNVTLAAVLLLALNVWTTQDNSAYAFGLAGATLTGVPGKRPFVVGGIAIAVVLALSGIYEALPQYLVLLGVLIPPLGGTIIGDYLFVWRGTLPPVNETRFVPFRWTCIAAYAAGTVTAVVTDQLAYGLPPVQGIIVAILAVPVFEWCAKVLGRHTIHGRLDLADA